MASNNINYFGFGDIFQMSFFTTFDSRLVYPCECVVFISSTDKLISKQTLNISLRFFACLCRMVDLNYIILNSSDSFLEHGIPLQMQYFHLFSRKKLSVVWLFQWFIRERCTCDAQFSFQLLLMKRNELMFIWNFALQRERRF